MLRIHVATIPSTGTHFCRDHLLAGHELVVEHIWGRTNDGWRKRLAELAPDDKILIPLRSPFKVAQSWKRHARDLTELPACWSRLVAEFDRPHRARIRYLPIDQATRRDAFLEELNHAWGLKLKTDWPIVRQAVPFYRGAAELSAQEINEVIRIMLELREFLEPFGYEVGNVTRP